MIWAHKFKLIVGNTVRPCLINKEELYDILLFLIVDIYCLIVNPETPNILTIYSKQQLKVITSVGLDSCKLNAKPSILSLLLLNSHMVDI